MSEDFDFRIGDDEHNKVLIRTLQVQSAAFLCLCSNLVVRADDKACLESLKVAKETDERFGAVIDAAMLAVMREAGTEW